MGGRGGLTPRPGCFPSGKGTRYPFHERLVGPQS